MTPPDRAPESRSRSNRPWWTELPEPRLDVIIRAPDESARVLTADASRLDPTHPWVAAMASLEEEAGDSLLA